MQQDAEECLTEMLNCLNVVKTAGGKGIADENFGIEMQTETSLAEAEGGFEEPHIRTEKLYKLSCHIQGSKPQADGSSKGGTDLMPQVQRPTNACEETYYCLQRGLLMPAKRPANVCTCCRRVLCMAWRAHSKRTRPSC